MDIALEQYGNVEGVFQLVKDNEQLRGITDNVKYGDTILISEEYDELKPKTKAYLSKYKIATLREEERANGIGWWVINKDFKING